MRAAAQTVNMEAYSCPETMVATNRHGLHIPQDLNLRLIKALYFVIKEESKLQEIAVHVEEVHGLPFSMMRRFMVCLSATGT